MHAAQHHNDHHNDRSSRRPGDITLAALTLTLLVLGLAGCERAYWDPTVKVGSSRGNLTGRPGTTASGAEATGLGDDSGIDLDKDKKTKKAVTTVQKGTGSFVRRVTGPSVDTSPGDVTLNFDGTDIREVVKVILGDLLQVNYVLSPAVQGVASLQTSRPLRREHLIPTLETLLRMNNAAIVYNSGTYEVVPIANAVQGNLVPQLGESTRALPPGYSIQIIPLQYISADEMNRILQPLAPEGSIVRVDTLRNLLVVAATNPEMGNLIDTVKVFDVDWMKGLSVGFFVLEYANPKDIATQLEGLLADDSGNPMKGLFRFIPVETSKSLMVISPQERYIQQARDWIERLDQAEANGTAAERIFVYRVKHGSAENLADLLSQLFGGDDKEKKKQSVGGVAPGLGSSSIGSRAVIGQAGSGLGGSGLGGGSSTGIGSGSGSGSGFGKSSSSGLSGGQGVPGGAGGEGRTAKAHTFQMSSDVSVVADATNNSILIRSNPKDYKKILDALKQLDILPLQVLVEATVIEVTLSGALQYGIQWRMFAHASDGYKSAFTLNDPKSSIFSNSTTTTGTTTGTTTSTTTGTTTDITTSTLSPRDQAANAVTNVLNNAIGSAGGFNWAIIANPSRLIADLHALAGQSLVNVLSSPSVMVIDNEVANIEVVKEVPVTTGAQQSSQANANVVNTYDYKTVGVKLRVKPRVTPGGLVQMGIEQEVSNQIADTTGVGGNPIFGKRQIKSTVAVRSSQAVVLGGLIQDNRNDGKSGIPGLYDIPFAGPLFGTRSKGADRTELIVILIPKVINSEQDVESVNNDFRDRMRGLQFKF